MRTQSWRNAYDERALDALDANPNVSRRELAQRLDMSLDEIDDILSRLTLLGVIDRPTHPAPTPAPVLHRIGRFK